MSATQCSTSKIGIFFIYTAILACFSKGRDDNASLMILLRLLNGFSSDMLRFPLFLSACNEKHWLEPELVEQPNLMQVKP